MSADKGLVKRRISVLAVLAALLPALAACGDDAVPREAEAAPSVNGIPQEAFVLGKPDAPALAIYLDPFCVGERCTALDPTTMKTIIERYVRPGRLQVALRPITTPGYPEYGVREAYAADLQGRGWQYVLTYLTRSNSQVDPDVIASEVPGLDVGRLERDADSARVRDQVRETRERADRRHATVPSAYFDPPGRDDEDIERLPLTSGSSFLRALGRAMDRTK